MEVIKKCVFIDEETSKSIHLVERTKRLQAYKDLLSLNFIQSFIVDTSHINGCEIHAINENGLIYIYNLHSHKLVTILHPRPSQLKRYYRALEIEIPQEIQRVSRQCYSRNEKNDYNNK